MSSSYVYVHVYVYVYVYVYVLLETWITVCEDGYFRILILLLLNRKM